mmetsp:Transcript_84242/g.133525  ORF Transcript_84242/g.133525 Transcript_84242/m.133525 type:complete len:114 (+) Transcript_84242:991-1332(+)
MRSKWSSNVRCYVANIECRAEPWETNIGKKKLRIDPELDTLENLEYLVEHEGIVRLKEVMFRIFGEGTDPAIFGDLPPRLWVDDRPGFEYRWTEMLQTDFRARGLYLSGHQHA